MHKKHVAFDMISFLLFFNQRTKQKNCMECEKNPLPLSIYCSEECIERHVLRVKERFKRVRMTSNLKALAKVSFSYF